MTTLPVSDQTVSTMVTLAGPAGLGLLLFGCAASIAAYLLFNEHKTARKESDERHERLTVSSQKIAQDSSTAMAQLSTALDRLREKLDK